MLIVAQKDDVDDASRSTNTLHKKAIVNSAGISLKLTVLLFNSSIFYDLTVNLQITEKSSSFVDLKLLCKH